jgi:signal transduction histidine kinase
MNLPASPCRSIIPFDYEPSLHFSSYNAVPDHKDLDIPFPATKSWQDRSARFVAALAHEIRNPLTNINLSIDMAKSIGPDKELDVYFDIVMRASMRINHLINELLLYQEIQDSATKKHSLHQLLDEALTLAAERILLKKITVRKEYQTGDDKICVEKEKTGIALTNIIINAIEAMSAENGELSLITRSIGNRYVLEIADNGTGIKSEQLKDIFRPHFTNKPGGLGLGLSTTLEILQYNHVIVDVSSEEGKGTRFLLFFNKAL